MFKLFNSKKGINDISMMWGILLVFVLLGVILPFVQSEFGETVITNNDDDLTAGIDDTNDLTGITAFTLITSVAKMFFWTFGVLPFYLDAVFVVFRIVFGLLLYRQIRSGGG